MGGESRAARGIMRAERDQCGEAGVMPMYEYVCERCGHMAEFLEKADTAAEHTCPECNCKKMNKVFSSFAARSAGSSGNGGGGGSSCRSCSAGSCTTCRR